MTQSTVAERSGQSIHAISAYERGVRHPARPAVVRRLAAAVGGDPRVFLRAAGFLASGAVAYEVETTKAELQAESEVYPWPSLLNNENLEVAGGNAAAARLAGFRLGQLGKPGDRHLLRLALDKRIRPRLANLEEILGQLAGIMKSDGIVIGGPARGPRFFQSVVEWITTLGPQTSAWLFGLWAAAEPWGIGRRLTFEASWHPGDGNELAFHCVIAPWSMLLGVWAFDWHPANGGTWEWLDAAAADPVPPVPEAHWSALIEERREAYGLTRPEVAAMTGVSASAVYQWERGKRRPTHANLTALVVGAVLDGATAGRITDALGYEPIPGPAYRFLAGETVAGRPELESMELIEVDVELIQASIDAHSWPVIVVNGDGDVAAANAAARRLLPTSLPDTKAMTLPSLLFSPALLDACRNWDVVAPLLLRQCARLLGWAQLGAAHPDGRAPNASLLDRYARAAAASPEPASARAFTQLIMREGPDRLRFNVIVGLWNIWDRYVAIDMHPADAATSNWTETGASEASP